MEAGDIGQLRDEKKTLIYASNQTGTGGMPEGGLWIQTIEKTMVLCVVDATFGTVKEILKNGTLSDPTVDLLPFKLT